MRIQKGLMDYGLSAIKHLPNKEEKSENIVTKLKRYEEIIEEDLNIIEKVGSDGTIVKNQKKKVKKSKNNMSFLIKQSKIIKINFFTLNLKN